MSGEPVPNRDDLLIALLAASDEFLRSTTPEEHRCAWASYFKALHDMIHGLPGNSDELARAVSPIEALVKDLAALDGGASPARFAKTKPRGAPKAELDEVANKAIAAAVIDQLMTEPGMTREAAIQKVFRAMKRHEMVSSDTPAGTIGNFRRDIYKYGHEALSIKNNAAAVINSRPPAERSRFAMRFLVRPGRLNVPRSNN